MELGRGVHRGSLTTRLIVLFTREPFNISRMGRVGSIDDLDL